MAYANAEDMSEEASFTLDSVFTIALMLKIFLFDPFFTKHSSISLIFIRFKDSRRFARSKILLPLA